MKYIESCSFGKDSLAMLLLLIEKKFHLDEVVFYDTGMEFKAIYNIRVLSIKPKWYRMIRRWRYNKYIKKNGLSEE